MEKEQLGEIIIESQDSLYHVAKTLLSNDADCCDAIQESIVKAFSKIQTLRSDKYVKTWLTRILINECYAIMRRERKVISIESYNIDGNADEQHDYTELYDAIMRLPEDSRLIITLYYMEGYSVREIAELLNITESAVKNRMLRARANIKDMIKQEVNRQVNAKEHSQRRKRISFRKAAVFLLAGVMLLGTTAFAANQIYNITATKQGKYSVKTKINNTKAVKDSEVIDIPMVKKEVTYLPENMECFEKDKYSFKGVPRRGGVTFEFIGMDCGDDKFEINDKYIVNSENIKLGSHDGVVLQFKKTTDNRGSMDKKIYVFYPEVHYVMVMYVGSDLSKEEAIKIAEGVKLTETTDENDPDIVNAWNWSSYSSTDDGGSNGTSDLKVTATKDEMKNTHKIGDSFYINYTDSQSNSDEENIYNTLSVNVKDVQILDNVNILDRKYIDQDLSSDISKDVDKDGNLLPTTIEYIKDGNGVDTLDNVISTKQTAQKLMYVTVNYTNRTDKDLKDVMYSVECLRVRNDNNVYTLFNSEQPVDKFPCDFINNSGISGMGHSMLYYDVHGGERDNNYIGEIKAGETKTVHVAFLLLRRNYHIFI